jgi:hypothetical protein
MVSGIKETLRFKYNPVCFALEIPIIIKKKERPCQDALLKSLYLFATA